MVHSIQRSVAKNNCTTLDLLRGMGGESFINKLATNSAVACQVRVIAVAITAPPPHGSRYLQYLFHICS